MEGGGFFIVIFWGQMKGHSRGLFACVPALCTGFVYWFSVPGFVPVLFCVCGAVSVQLD